MEWQSSQHANDFISALGVTPLSKSTCMMICPRVRVVRAGGKEIGGSGWMQERGMGMGVWPDGLDAHGGKRGRGWRGASGEVVSYGGEMGSK